jgi:hypothetical protein
VLTLRCFDAGHRNFKVHVPLFSDECRFKIGGKTPPRIGRLARKNRFLILEDRLAAMTDLVIHYSHSPRTESCALCGGRTASRGPQLHCAETGDVVCRTCGKNYAPSLVALLDLACTAERVGRIGRHNLVPPLTSLLDLARAAENYSLATPSPARQVA